jgi:hypothetical protein
VERRHGEHRAEDLLLEDPHAVVPLEHGRLVEVAAGEVAADVGSLAADEHLGTFLPAVVDVRADLLRLLRRHLRADHRRRVERVAPA